MPHPTIGRVSRPPRIALTLSLPDSPERVDSRDYYVAALVAAGAEVVEVYPGDTMPADVDGLLLAGGGDIDPARSFETTDDGAWLVGVQWHPERAHEVSAEATGIIKAFVEQAASR
jgi:gamma-glutamyl-gamma-aminobutyrate hydrolase PuuD